MSRPFQKDIMFKVCQKTPAKSTNVQRRTIIMPGLLLHSNWFKSIKFWNIYKGFLLYCWNKIDLRHIILSSKWWPRLSYRRRSEKGFDIFLLKHINVDLITELFLLQLIWLYFLLKSTYIYKQFTRVLHSWNQVVIWRILQGVYSRRGTVGPLVKRTWFRHWVQRLKKKLKCNQLDVVYERVDEVEDSRRTRILTRLTAMV